MAGVDTCPFSGNWESELRLLMLLGSITRDLKVFLGSLSGSLLTFTQKLLPPPSWGSPRP